MATHIEIADLGDAPAAGGTPVRLVDSSGRVVGEFSHVVDAVKAQMLQSVAGEGASGAFANVTSMPSGTPLPDQTGAVVSNPTTPGNHAGDGWTDKDPRTPDLGSFAGVGDSMGTVADYGNQPPQRQGSSITTPGYTKTNTMPMVQMWEADPNATLNPIDLQPQAPFTHPSWRWPHDVNP